MPKSLHAAEVRDEVSARLSALGAASRPRWGKLDAGRMLCHLGDSLRMALGDLEVRGKGKPGFQRFPLKHLLLYVLPWPRGAPTAPELLSTASSGFAGDAARLRALVLDFGRRGDQAGWPAHPLFGPLSRNEWGRLTYSHIDHHFRQFGI